MKITEVMNQMDLRDFYRNFHLDTNKYAFFSAHHGSFSKIDHKVRNKASLNRYKKTDITPCIQLHCHVLELDLSYDKKSKTPAHISNLNNCLLNDRCVVEEIKTEIKDVQELIENEGATYQNSYDKMKAMLKGKFIVFSAFIKKLETCHTSNLTTHLKDPEKNKKIQTHPRGVDGFK